MRLCACYAHQKSRWLEKRVYALCKFPKASKKLLILYICIYKMAKENFELRQDGWLKGNMNGAFKLPGGLEVCGSWHRIEDVR